MTSLISLWITLSFILKLNAGYTGQYDVYDGLLNGLEAKALCESYGTTLATVITSQDLTNLQSAVFAVVGSGYSQGVWIGLRDQETERVFTFDDGTVKSIYIF